MKTQDLIQALSDDMKKTGRDTTLLSPRSYSLYWFSGALFVFLLSLKLLPVREDLVNRLEHQDFQILCFLWLGASVLAAIRTYRSVFPALETENQRLRYDLLAALPFIALTAWTITQFPLSDLGHELSREKSYLNGGCGAVILVAGLIHGFVLARWLKRGAPTSLFRTGAWAAISTGAFTSFIIQFACGNEHPLHVMLWHAIPLTLLSATFGGLSTRLLKW